MAAGGADPSWCSRARSTGWEQRTPIMEQDKVGHEKAWSDRKKGDGFKPR